MNVLPTLGVRHEDYYVFREHIYIGGEIGYWVLQKHLYTRTLGLLNGVEVLNNNISRFAWKEFEKCLKGIFFMKFLQVKIQTPYMLLFLMIGSLPIEIIGIEMIDCLELQEKQLKIIEDTKISFLVLDRLKKWYGRWDVLHLLHDVPLDSLMNEDLLQCTIYHDMVETMEADSPESTHYIAYVVLNYKTLFFYKQGNYTRRRNTTQPIPFCSLSTQSLLLFTFLCICQGSEPLLPYTFLARVFSFEY